MNSIMLTGYVTNVPTTTTHGELAITKFSFAVKRKGKEDKTDYFDVVTFGKQAQLAADYIKKGILLGIQGSMLNNSYKNKEGQKVYKYEVNCSGFEFLEPKGNGTMQNTNTHEELVWRVEDCFGNSAMPNTNTPQNVVEDEIPLPF